MSLRIFKAGVMDTIQDVGRYGWQHLGINPGGSIDRFSAQVANLLVGNLPGEALVELHFPASAFFFEEPELIALAGADFSATVNGEPVPNNHPLLLSKYSILQFQRKERGTTCYLAVSGGLRVEKWLNSYSTHVTAGIGGYNGRSLQKEDYINMASTPAVAEAVGNKE